MNGTMYLINTSIKDITLQDELNIVYKSYRLILIYYLSPRNENAIPNFAGTNWLD